jgi:hypothetical protein
MKRRYLFLLPLLSLLLLGNNAFSQNVEQLGLKDDIKNFFKGFKEADPFKMSGSFGLSTRSYFALNTMNRQAPFTWNLNARLNMSIYKIRIPLSAVVSAQNKSVSHPFTQETFDGFSNRRFTRVGASPYYKWAKVHLGHRSLNFSPFTLANHTFLGAGVELTPGNIRFAAFYGGMAKAEPRDLSLLGLNRQIFNRRGFGVKTGYGNNQNFIDLILFTAKDQENQFAPINRDSATVFRNENAVLGINGQVTVFEKVQMKLEIASSGFTKNAVDPLSDVAQTSIPNFLLAPRTSTTYRTAINAGVNFQLGIVNLGAGYKRVEPDYRSLGTYFFNDDLEDYTINMSTSLFKNKLRINGSGGLQRNNLFGVKATQYSRAIGSVNLNYAVNSLNLGLNYSNNSSAIDYVLNAELDSLNAIVITNSLGFNAAYSIVSENSNRHLFSLNLSTQGVTDEVEDPNRSAASQMLNAIFSYRYSPKESGWKYNARLSYNQNELSQMLINRYGGSLGLDRQLIPDKWSLALNANYFYSQGETRNTQTLTIRLNSPFRINEHHRLDMGISYLNRLDSRNTGIGDFQEYIGTINYVYTF